MSTYLEVGESSQKALFHVLQQNSGTVSFQKHVLGKLSLSREGISPSFTGRGGVRRRLSFSYF